MNLHYRRKTLSRDAETKRLIFDIILKIVVLMLETRVLVRPNAYLAVQIGNMALQHKSYYLLLANI